MELDIFSQETTSIICNTPEGNKIAVDIFVLDDMLIKVDQEHPETRENGSLQLKLLCDMFNEEFNYKISRASMSVLLEAKTKKLEELKKSTLASSSLASSME